MQPLIHGVIVGPSPASAILRIDSVAPANTSAMTGLILASTSPYRRALLQRLGLDFRCVAPCVDEAHRGDEAPSTRANRLARAKAEAVAVHEPEEVVIGSDQVAHVGEILLDQPGTPARAVAQLRQMSGRSVDFLTAVCVMRGQRVEQDIVCTYVIMRSLSEAEIQRYVLREQVLDCSGSVRCEGLGITLFESIQTPDPTALIGLPLMTLTDLLRSFGFDLP